MKDINISELNGLKTESMTSVKTTCEFNRLAATANTTHFWLSQNTAHTVHKVFTSIYVKKAYRTFTYQFCSLILYQITSPQQLTTVQVTYYSNYYQEVHFLLHNINVGIVLASKVRIASVSAYHILLYNALNIAPEVLLLFWLHPQTPATIKK